MAIHHSSDLWTLSVSSSDKPDGGLRQKASSYQLSLTQASSAGGRGQRKGRASVPVMCACGPLWAQAEHG